MSLLVVAVEIVLNKDDASEIAHAPKAVQSLTLTGSTAKDAFDAQTRALANIRELVYKQLALPSPSLHDTHGNIVLKRRVFTKVSAPCRAEASPEVLIKTRLTRNLRFSPHARVHRP